MSDGNCVITDALEPGLGAFPGRRERLVLGRAAAHAHLDGGRHERPVAEAGRRLIAHGRGRDGGGGRGRARRRGRVVAGLADVRDADEAHRRRTLRLLDEVQPGVHVL